MAIVADAVEGLVSGVGGILDELFTSDEERQKIVLAMEKIKSSEFIEGLKINQTEASHASIFVAGARPALIWACVAALAYEGVLRGILAWFIQVLVILFGIPELPALPSISDSMMEFVGLAFSLAGIRGIETVRGVARKSLK